MLTCIHLPRLTIPMEVFEANPPLSGVEWSRRVVSTNAHFYLAGNDQYLAFGCWCSSPPLIHPLAPSGDFFEGLWEYDVAELFISVQGSSKYWEFNIAPNGSWWGAKFQDYRERLQTLESTPGIKHFGETSESGWRAALLIPLDVFSVQAWETMFLGNLTAIVHKTYLSHAQPPASAPDFHLAELRQGLTIIE